MRRCYLVCYDISDSKRLRKVYELMKGYGQSWQYSVFFCVLKDMDRVKMQVDLEEQINQREDQVLVIEVGSSAEKFRGDTTTLGKSLPDQPSGMVVI